MSAKYFLFYCKPSPDVVLREGVELRPFVPHGIRDIKILLTYLSRILSSYNNYIVYRQHFKLFEIAFNGKWAGHVMVFVPAIARLNLDEPVVELSISIGNIFRRKGIATTAIALSLQEGERCISRIPFAALVDITNLQSIELFRKFAYSEVEVVRKSGLFSKYIGTNFSRDSRSAMDKKIEQDRYDNRVLQGELSVNEGALSINSIPLELRTPYCVYEDKLRESLSSARRVLEIGAGYGMHTNTLLNSSAELVIVTDISLHSMVHLRKANILKQPSFCSCVADMECLPFASETFDVVSSAGCLSYGDNELVLGEILRVLRPGGRFICVDSLNSNLIYKINRWMHYLRGNRTWSTLVRMPTPSLIERYRKKFRVVSVRYFGALSFLAPFLKVIIGQKRTARISDSFDQIVHVRNSAFKFVMVCQKEG